MSSASLASPCRSARLAADGVTSSPRSVGSNAAPVSRVNTITPSVVDAAHPCPVGANVTCLHRITGRFFTSSPLLRDEPAPFHAPAPGRDPPGPPLPAPPRPRSPRLKPSSSSSESDAGSRSIGPASVTRFESSRSIVPSSALLLLNGNFFSKALPSTSYMHTYLPLPPASNTAPSAEYARVLNDLLALAVADRRSPMTLPPAISRRPSMVPCI
mmetsp:Transcript_12623/g.57324  ORF Transcript_12623/g.57324 Transcript_12623/m.57324 type:complete len:214 (+) Transcript_12623:541-1182(+)